MTKTRFGFKEFLTPIFFGNKASRHKNTYSQQSENPKEPPHFVGHRQRLRDKFMNAGRNALADYEIIELILFRTIPKRDVKPLAKRILKHFDNDFNKALTSTAEELQEIPGVGPAVACELKIVEAAAHLLAQSKVMHKEIITSWEDLMTYCETVCAHERIEQFRVLYLDRKNTLIADECQQKGTIDHVPVYPREVVKRGLTLHASALILVHNHPSGDPTPSEADLLVTNQIVDACEVMGMTVHDHVIIGKGDIFSFRSNGLIA